MENEIKNKRQRKFLLILPLLVIPFATMLFWALGGGKSAQAQSNAGQLKGLNVKLPGAKLKEDSTADKLSFYLQSEKDSLKFKQAQKDDPNYHGDTLKNKAAGSTDSGIRNAAKNSIGNRFATGNLNSSGRSLSNDEAQINQKLAVLKQQINQAPAPQRLDGNNQTDSELQHLEPAMQKMNSTSAPDPEIQQLNGMLEKIQEIQNPGLAQQKLREQSEKRRGQVFAVSSVTKSDPVSTLGNGSTRLITQNDQPNGFYSFENISLPADSQNAVEAVVHETQTVTSGSTVKLRLTNDIYINGGLIPKDNFVFGTASLNGERLSIKISSIRYRNCIYPVDLSVYDMDGGDGIYIPGAITRDVAKESADQSIQNLGFTSYDPSLGAQAASAGIAAAKTLFSRKVKLVKVTIKAGYQVLLRDEKQKQSN